MFEIRAVTRSGPDSGGTLLLLYSKMPANYSGAARSRNFGLYRKLYIRYIADAERAGIPFAIAAGFPRGYD